MRWIREQILILEKELAKELDRYSNQEEVSIWAKSITGIGRVIAAGLMAHIDVEKFITTGKLYAFAGFNPNMVWKRGQKRPFNASLKTLCWKAGESFVKNSKRSNSLYGQLYVERNEYETRLNEQGHYRKQAEELAKKFSHSTESYKYYKEGMLPPGHIHSRAKRYAVKIFLSHYLEVGRRLKGLEIVKPYPIAHMGHVDYIPPPNIEVVGLKPWW
jgi:hypothetical protein